MNSEGSGLGLQIQGGLASQWFESTFCAHFFFSSSLDQSHSQKSAPKVRLELTTYRLTAGRAADCAIRDHLVTTKTEVCSMRGSNPRLLAHKTNTLPTELMELYDQQCWPSG
jgi:hypothetical protein